VGTRKQAQSVETRKQAQTATVGVGLWLKKAV